MSGIRLKINTVILLGLLLHSRAFSQQQFSDDSNSIHKKVVSRFKPEVHYSAGSEFMFFPHAGSITGFNLSSSVSVPLSSRLTVEGGLTAGRFYSSLPGFSQEGIKYPAFNMISVYGSASYHISPQLTVYGAGIKQITGSSPFFSLPRNIYTIGSTYNFGNFSIGVTLHMSDWNRNYNLLPLNGSQGFFSPFTGTQGIPVAPGR
ncbi:MAG TPA: hypothetical protein VMT63_12635 [Bacteroidales bacterium]|nr:hypothetical protein [Bacteroidales bacterium]